MRSALLSLALWDSALVLLPLLSALSVGECHPPSQPGKPVGSRRHLHYTGLGGEKTGPFKKPCPAGS